MYGKQCWLCQPSLTVAWVPLPYQSIIFQLSKSLILIPTQLKCYFHSIPGVANTKELYNLNSVSSGFWTLQVSCVEMTIQISLDLNLGFSRLRPLAGLFVRKKCFCYGTNGSLFFVFPHSERMIKSKTTTRKTTTICTFDNFRDSTIKFNASDLCQNLVGEIKERCLVVREI